MAIKMKTQTKLAVAEAAVAPGTDPGDMAEAEIVEEVAEIDARAATLKDRREVLVAALRVRTSNQPPEKAVVFHGRPGSPSTVTFAALPNKTEFVVTPAQAHASKTLRLADILNSVAWQVGLMKDYLTPDQRAKIIKTERDETKARAVKVSR